MLVGRSDSAPRRRVACLIAWVAVFAAPAAAWYVAAAAGWAAWPGGSTLLGLWLAIVAAAIIAFEMLLAPRKWLRGWRLGPARWWMRAHVWLGLASLPLVVCHAGFRFGGPLPAAVLILYLLVFVSGVWGLALQQTLPSKLLHDFPNEAVETQVDSVMGRQRDEAERLVEATAGGPGDPVRAFWAEHAGEYLRDGRRSGSALRSAARAAGLFADLAARQPAAAATVRRLEELCADRRRYDTQARIHWWLHNWLCVHLPLSVALTVLLVAHAVTALKYW